MMNNYDRMQEDARQRFLRYPSDTLAAKPGTQWKNGCLVTWFFGQRTCVSCDTGRIMLDGRPAEFSEALSVYDWLCDRAADAAAAEIFCPVASLPGVYVGGGGLSMTADTLAGQIHGDPDGFRSACESMGGVPTGQADLGYRLDIFPGLPMCLKFYFGDEEFPPSLTLLWDRNILQFVRYETVYYIAGCLQRRLTRLMAG